MFVCGSLNSCQLERMGEENALPHGGTKFLDWAKVPLTSDGTKELHNNNEAEREGGEHPQTMRCPIIRCREDV